MEGLPILVILISILIWSSLSYLEHRQIYTLRFQLAPWLADLVVLPALSIVYLLYTAWISQISEDFTRDVVSSFFIKVDFSFLVVFLRSAWLVFIGACTVVFVVVFVRDALPFIESRRYLQLRWKAWSGASRTGIAPIYVGFLGTAGSWGELSRSNSWSTNLSSGISADPADLLKEWTRTKAAKEKESVLEGVVGAKHAGDDYEPFLRGHSLSLLWGEHLGFARRCSRGILSVPKSMLSCRPTFDAGYDARPLVLAYGILARNKGPKPWNLVCNLQTQKSMRIFEENCRQWPRPSKSLRSIYRTEMHRTFYLLGDSFVTAATELALLFADTEFDVIEDWLEGRMEHQDLSFNHLVAKAGASTEDLARLYVGQYAAMLVSLATHRIGVRCRPELMVYEALCRVQGVENKQRWILSSSLLERRKIEVAILGVAGQNMISTII
jgi:hypothetical protein